MPSEPLRPRLEALRAKFEPATPSPTLGIMLDANEALRRSGALERVLRPGDRAPDFILENTEGEQIDSSALRARGPLVLSFYRGHW